MTPSSVYGVGMMMMGGGGGGSSSNNNNNNNGLGRHNHEDDNCRHCGALGSLWTDWSSGDVVCRECGVVAQGHVRFEGAEWREFAADVADGLGPSGGVARCDLTVQKTNEMGVAMATTTTLVGGDANVRKRLLRAHHTTQTMLDRQYKAQLKQDKLTIDIQECQQKELSNVDDNLPTLHSPKRIKKLKKEDPLITNNDNNDNNNDNDNNNSSSKQLKLQLAADKWSLSRALHLFQNNDNNNNNHEEKKDMDDFSWNVKKEEDGNNNNNHNNNMPISSVQMKCARELYTAYSKMERAVEMLSLPIKPVQEQAMDQLRTYVSLKDGWTVPKLTHDKTLQISSIVTTFLYLACKQYGYTRTLKETCHTTTTLLQNNNNEEDIDDDKIRIVIKPKHCSKVMKDIQLIMPQSIRNATKHPNNVHNDDFVKHFCKPLKLPPNAIQAIQTCITNFQNWQIKFGIAAGIQPANICAAMTYFVGWIGNTYSNFLLTNNYQQQQHKHQHTATNTSKKRTFQTSSNASNAYPDDTTNSNNNLQSNKFKKQKREDPDNSSNSNNNNNDDSNDQYDDQDEFLHDMIIQSTEIPSTSTTNDNQNTSTNNDDNNNNNNNSMNALETRRNTFDIMSDDAIPQSIHSMNNNNNGINDQLRNQWEDEKSWYRDMSHVERSCHVSRRLMTDLLKKYILPHKDELLQALENEQPTDNHDNLLKNISNTVGPLLTWNSLKEKIKLNEQ